MTGGYPGYIRAYFDAHLSLDAEGVSHDGGTLHVFTDMMERYPVREVQAVRGPSDGGEQPVVVDAQELRSLAQAARRARADVDHALSRVAGIMGPLNVRGWNASAADRTWSCARSGLLNLEADFDQRAAILARRGNLVDRFETGQLTGDVAWDDAETDKQTPPACSSRVSVFRSRAIKPWALRLWAAQEPS